MPKHQRLLIAIADGEHARFLRPDAHHVLRRDTSLDSAAAHKRSADIGTDRPGAAFHSDSSAHHALAPRHDLHAQQKVKFAHAVADLLNEAAAADGFDTLVLVAPAHSMQAIRGHLDTAAADRLIGTLEKDLVKTPDEDLASHLRDWVRPPAHVPL